MFPLKKKETQKIYKDKKRRKKKKNTKETKENKFKFKLAKKT
jgi:hypothetical protein